MGALRIDGSRSQQAGCSACDRDRMVPSTASNEARGENVEATTGLCTVRTLHGCWLSTTSAVLCWWLT